MSGRKRARSPLRIVDYDDEFDDDSYSNSESLESKKKIFYFIFF